MSALVDGHGRVHDDLRVSVTDRCNLRCGYCMPVEPQWFPRAEILTYEEIVRLVRVACDHGVRRVRITGGEPLVRRDLPRLVALLAGVAAITDLSLTTNGLLLEPLAADLAAAGLRRVNVSLDTLSPECFRELTRRDGLSRVLAGLEAAVEAGLAPVKLNTVLLRGVNDGELEPLVERARDRGFELRFIEFMPLENGASWDLARVVTGDEVRRRIARRWPIEPEAPADAHAPARSYRFCDGGGRVGFIDSVSRPFCASCSRLRLTADGKLRVCLYDDRETDLKGPLRAGAGADELGRRMAQALRGKGPGGALEILERRAALPLARTMHQIGG
jgi:cyclic pyranopterin phosphate synthase